MSTKAEISLKMGVSSRDADGFYEKPSFTHHNYTALEKFLEKLHDNYPSITRLYSIGKSVEGRELYVLEMTSESKEHEIEKPQMRYVANMHGNEVVGREILLLFCKYLCENYGTDPRVTRILNGVQLHVLPSLNPDGYELAHEDDYNGSKGRANAHGVTIDENFSQYEKYQASLNIVLYTSIGLCYLL
jgi:carboxypeptidase D